MSKPKIGNRSSALQRIGDYIVEFKRCLLREPVEIVLFAEDFDALGEDVPARYRKRYKFVRGPSIDEYRSEAVYIPPDAETSGQLLGIYTGDRKHLSDFIKSLPRLRDR